MVRKSLLLLQALASFLLPACSDDKAGSGGYVGVAGSAGAAGIGGGGMGAGAGGASGGGAGTGTGATSFGPCIAEADGHDTCAAACVSIGETCPDAGCALGTSRFTYLAWGSAGVDQCEALESDGVGVLDDCQAVLDWDRIGALRCCCTETR